MQKESKMTTKKKWTQLGTIRKGQSGNLYIRFDNDVENLKELKNAVESQMNSILEGEDKKPLALQLEKPSVKLNRLLDLGYIDEGEFQRRLEKIPEYIRQEISLPPQDN